MTCNCYHANNADDHDDDDDDDDDDNDVLLVCPERNECTKALCISGSPTWMRGRKIKISFTFNTHTILVQAYILHL